MRSRAKRPTQFGVCRDNRGYPASLEVGKLYPVIPDAEAAKHGYLRVMNESGEDYGYSANRFIVLQVPEVLDVDEAESTVIIRAIRHKPPHKRTEEIL